MDLKAYLKGLGLGIFVTAIILSLSTGKNNQMTDDEIRERALELGMVSENSVLLTQAQALADNAKEKAEIRVSENAAAKNAAAEKISGETTSANDISGNSTSVSSVSAKPSASGAASAMATSSGNASEGPDTDKTASVGASSGNAVADKASTDGDNTTDTDKKTGSKEKTDTASATDKEDIAVGGQSGSDVVINISSGDSSISVANKLLKAGLINDAKQFDTYLVLSGYDRNLVVGSHTIPAGSSAEEMAKILTTKQ